MWFPPLSEAATSAPLTVRLSSVAMRGPPRGSLPQHLGRCPLIHKAGQVLCPMGWLPLLNKRFSFPRVGKCPANQRSGSRQGLCALRGPGAGHQAALAGPRNPGVLRQEEGVPALRLCQIVSTEPRRAAPSSRASMLHVPHRSFPWGVSSHLKPSVSPWIPDFSPCPYPPVPAMS